MASKRATNNSSVTSLEEQSQVIESVLEKEALKRSNRPRNSEKNKNSSKNKSADVASPSPPLDGARAKSADVTAAKKVTAAAGAAPVAKATGDGREDARRAPGNLPSNGPGAVLLPPEVIPGLQAFDLDSGMFGETPEVPDVTSAHQRWLWQQQQQMMVLQQFQQYGNFVPNFALGGGFLPTAWDQEDPADWASAQPRPVHEISDDEDDPQPAEPLGEVEEIRNDPQGGVADLIKLHLTKVKESDKVSPKVEEGVADVLKSFLEDTQFPGELERLAKTFHRVENVPQMTVPRIDEEVYQVVDHKVKNNDQSLQAIQKGVTGTLAAFTPILALAFTRGQSDPELVELSTNLVEGIRLLAFTHSAISAKRRDLIRPHLSPIYGKALSKVPEGAAPEWLFGGKLGDTAKQCETVKQLGVKLAKRKPNPPPQQRGGQQKRFRPPFPMQSLPTYRPYNPWQQQQQVRFANPMSFQQTYQQPFQSYQPNFVAGFPRRFRPARQQKQPFGKKGAHQK